MQIIWWLLLLGYFMGKIEAPGEERKGDLTDFQKGRIYALHFDAEWTLQAIADKLSISVNTVKSYCRRAKDDPEKAMGNRNCCGRKRKTSIQSDRQIKRISLNDPFKDATAILNELPEAEKICKRTVQNRLMQAGLGGGKRPINLY